MNRCIVKILGAGATNFAACFYNEKKVAEGDAKCVSMRNFGELGDYFIHSPVVLSRYMQKIADHNKFVKHPQKHICWSFPGKATPEQLEQLLKDAQTTMDRLGYEGQPQVFWVHNDTKNTHIHGASVTVSVKNGFWIDNWKEGRRARRIMDQLRGVSTMNAVDKLLSYKFENREQFKSLLISTGYRCHLDEQNKCYDIYHCHELIGSVSTEELDDKIAANGKNKDNCKDFITNLRGILLDRRRRSLKQNVTEPIKVNTRDGVHTVTKSLGEVKTRFNGDKGIHIEGERKAQFKQFLIDLKRELGISIVFSQYQDGKTKGYTLIDHKDGLVFKGSDIVDLQKLLNPSWRKGQEKDTILSADDAASMADDIRQTENLPQVIEQQLERLGVEFDPDTSSAMQTYGHESEEDNRSKAVAALRQVISMVRNVEDATEEGSVRISSLAQEAVNRAACADGLRLLATQEQEAREKAEQVRLTNLQRAKNRLQSAKGITAGEIGDFVVDFLDDFGIEHSPYENLSERKSDYPMETGVQIALEKLHEAIEAENPEERKKWGSIAMWFAKGAESCWKEAAKAKTKPASPQVEAQKPTPEQPKQFARTIPFVSNVDPSIFVGEDGRIYIMVNINGEETKPKLVEKQHLEWYQQHNQNYDQAAQDLAIHYFGDEIQKQMMEDWKQRHFDAGKMPFGYTIGTVSIYSDNAGNKFWIRGEFKGELGTKPYTASISRDEFIRIRNCNPEEKNLVFDQAACRHIGPKLLESARFPSVTELKDAYYHNDTSFDSVESINQSLDCFKAISERLCEDFAANCGAVAGVYLSLIFPAGGISTGGAGGGGSSQQSDWGRKKDDDDYKSRNLFDMKPKSKVLHK